MVFINFVILMLLCCRGWRLWLVGVVVVGCCRFRLGCLVFMMIVVCCWKSVFVVVGVCGLIGL